MRTGITVQGIVTEALPSGFFSVTLVNGSVVRLRPSGRLRKLTISVDDKVEVTLSEYDLTNGQITRRL